MSGMIKMNDTIINNIKFLLYCLIIMVNDVTLSILSLINYPDYVINDIIISSYRYAQILCILSCFFAVVIIIKKIKCRFYFTKFEKHVFRIFIIMHILIFSLYFYALV